MEIFGKTAVFPGGYGRIGDILHGRIWPDWGKGRVTLSNLRVAGPNLLRRAPHMVFLMPGLSGR